MSNWSKADTAYSMNFLSGIFGLICDVIPAVIGVGLNNSRYYHVVDLLMRRYDNLLSDDQLMCIRCLVVQ